MRAARRSPRSARTSSRCTSSSRRSRRATPSAPAATRASSSSVRAAATRPRWSSSSSSERAGQRRTPPAMTTKLTIEYDGTSFAGWARQPGKRTVEGELQRVLRTVLGDQGSDGQPLTLSVAGRTDRGVHAWGQVASYAHEAVDPLRLNGLLPADVAVLASEPAPEGFDARRDATSRTYCYRVIARRTRPVFERDRAYWWTGRLDLRALEECASALAGTHDFSAFTPTETE